MEADVIRESRELVAVVESKRQNYESIDPVSRSHVEYAAYLEELRDFLEGQFLVCGGHTRSINKAHCLEPIFETPLQPLLVKRVDLCGHPSGDSRYLFLEGEEGTTYEAYWAELYFEVADEPTDGQVILGRDSLSKGLPEIPTP